MIAQKHVWDWQKGCILGVGLGREVVVGRGKSWSSLVLGYCLFIANCSGPFG